jgi:hypothetical protein
MNGWRSRNGAWLWLLAPALSIGACGKTDQIGGDTNAAGGPSDNGGTPATGGTTLLPTPTAGVPGRAGSAPTPEGGAGGTTPVIMIPGISQMPVTVVCGGETCQSVKTLAPNVFVDPCCAGDACGVNTQFLAGVGAAFVDQCQATGQVGARDVDCPTSAAQVLPVMGMSLPVPGFVGCCRAETGTCGVIVDQITVSGLPFAAPQLGCVDSAPFFANKPGASCGDGAAGGAGGAGPGVGGAPAGGAGVGEAGAAGGG